MLDGRPARRKYRANAWDKGANGKTTAATRVLGRSSAAPLPSLGMQPIRRWVPVGATWCHARGQPCHTVSSRGHFGVTPLSLGRFGRWDERGQRGHEGFKGFTGCHRGSKPLPHAWHLSIEAATADQAGCQRCLKVPLGATGEQKAPRRLSPSRHLSVDGHPARVYRRISADARARPRQCRGCTRASGAFPPFLSTGRRGAPYQPWHGGTLGAEAT